MLAGPRAVEETVGGRGAGAGAEAELAEEGGEIAFFAGGVDEAAAGEGCRI